MKFLRVEWTKKRGVIALLATGLVVTSFMLGGYVATGNWNPWGNRHYYQVLNANFQECYTPVGGTPQCQSVHNVMFNTGAIYVEKLVTSNNEGFCTVGAACSFHFIAMSATKPLLPLVCRLRAQLPELQVVTVVSQVVLVVRTVQSLRL